jgi:hypothetical protein
MASLICLPTSDRIFGPRVDPSCRAFDFTLFFEDIFFACLPTAVFFLLLPFHITVLAKSPALCSVRSKLLLGKLVSPPKTLRCCRPAIDNCIGNFGRHSYNTSDSPDSKITEDYCPNKRIIGRRHTDNCRNCWCSMAFLYRPPTLTSALHSAQLVPFRAGHPRYPESPDAMADRKRQWRCSCNDCDIDFDSGSASARVYREEIKRRRRGEKVWRAGRV